MSEAPSPLGQAVAALAALVARGPAPATVTEAIGTLVAGWADEPDMSGEAMLARVETLWDGFSTDAAALQEQLADGEGDAAARRQAERVLDALNAAVDTLAAIRGAG